jgi:hypothetical protein
MVNLFKLQFLCTIVPLNPDDLIVPAKSFSAIFLDADGFSCVSANQYKDLS